MWHTMPQCNYTRNSRLPGWLVLGSQQPDTLNEERLLLLGQLRVGHDRLDDVVLALLVIGRDPAGCPVEHCALHADGGGQVVEDEVRRRGDQTALDPGQVGGTHVGCRFHVAQRTASLRPPVPEYLAEGLPLTVLHGVQQHIAPRDWSRSPASWQAKLHRCEKSYTLLLSR